MVWLDSSVNMLHVIFSDVRTLEPFEGMVEDISHIDGIQSISCVVDKEWYACTRPSFDTGVLRGLVVLSGGHIKHLLAIAEDPYKMDTSNLS